MLDIALFFVFAVMAYRIGAGVSREAPILREFKQPLTLAWLALLFPLGPFVILFGTRWLGFPLNFAAAAGCYLPALLVARHQRHVLETAGTDRVQTIQGTIDQAFGTGLAGLVYLGVLFVISVGAYAIGHRA